MEKPPPIPPQYIMVEFDSLFWVVDIMTRETVSKKAIRNLNHLSWDERHYANFQFADGVWGLEVNYYIRGKEWKYRVDCDSYEDMVALRRELDSRVK